MEGSILLWLTFLPLGAIPFLRVLNRDLAKIFALGISIIGVGLAVTLYVWFDPASPSVQFPVSFDWIRTFQIKLALGVDGLSFPLVLLTKLMMPIAFLASFSQDKHPRAMLANFLLLDCAMTGTFLARDIFLFYVFWELMLVPMILLIGIWGSGDRIYASMKFFLFTFAGSIFMLVAVFWVFAAHESQFGFYTGDISAFYGLNFSPAPILFGLSAQDLVFLGFTLAFLVKVPLFPLHTWLPDAHVQAPTGGSILLAAVLLKMGTYGILRFSIPICPNAFSHFANVLAVLSLVGILYGAWVAFQQTDMKKLVAYSSVSHLGFVVLGICTMNVAGLTGAVLQMINHGLTTGALFLMVGMLYERRHSRNFSDYGGIASVLPWFSFFLVFVCCASMAVPGLNGFVGEFLILLGAFERSPYWAAIAVTGVVFGAAYTLLLLRQVLFGQVTAAENQGLKDMSLREWCAIVPLCALMIILGVKPQPFVSKFRPALESYWTKIEPTGVKLARSGE